MTRKEFKTEQDILIDRLSNNLEVLRKMANVSQDELAKCVGISRQTYSSFERGETRMNWSRYLSLIFYFDNNYATNEFLKKMGIFPDWFVKYINGGEYFISSSEFRMNEEHHKILKVVSDLSSQEFNVLVTIIKDENRRRNIGIESQGGYSGEE